MSEAGSARLEWIRAAMDEYQGRLIRFTARITGDLDSARDVVQDTFLRLCREDPDKTRDHLAAGCSGCAAIGPWTSGGRRVP